MLEGPAQWSGGSHHKGRLTLPFEIERREKAKERGESLGSETFTVMVIGQSDLERQAAVLSKSHGCRPVALQRAAQQCLSQHINNSYVLVCMHPQMCAQSYSMCALSYTHSSVIYL